MICSDFCVFLNKFGYCEMTMCPPERITECPHSAIKRSVSAATGSGSTGGMPDAEA